VSSLTVSLGGFFRGHRTLSGSGYDLVPAYARIPKSECLEVRT